MNFWAANGSKIKVREEHERLAICETSTPTLWTLPPKTQGIRDILLAITGKSSQVIRRVRGKEVVKARNFTFEKCRATD